jgi:hypothetical protein
MTRTTAKTLGLVAALVIAMSVGARTAELKPATVAAFERYMRATEARIAAEVQDERRFLSMGGSGAPAATRLAELKAGKLVIERLETRDNGEAIDVPDGLVHHWLGVVFVPGKSVAEAVELLRDYDRHADIYRPAIQRSRLLEQTGDTYRVFLRFFMKKVIAVTLNTEHTARFTQVDARRAYSRVVSTRIQEVEDPGTASERELPVGNDGGYLWRINSYWRFLEQDGGVYVQCESVSLTRGIPFGLGWAVGPFVTSIPRESLTFTLETTREALASRK